MNGETVLKLYEEVFKEGFNPMFYEAMRMKMDKVSCSSSLTNILVVESGMWHGVNPTSVKNCRIDFVCFRWTSENFNEFNKIT